MREFHSPRTQIFSVWRFRRIVLPIATIALVYATLALFMPGPGTQAAASPAMAALVLPGKPVLIPQKTHIAAGSLREMFNTAPPRAIETGPIAIDNSAAAEQARDDQKTLAVGRGDTLMNLLVRNAVPRNDAHHAIAALRKVYNPRNLNPAHKITVFFQPDGGDGARFDGLAIQKDVVTSVFVNRSTSGGFSADAKEAPLHTETRAHQGVIDGALFIAAQNAGVPDGIVVDLIRMYSFAVDFQRDIQQGDKFELMYNVSVTEDGIDVPGREQIVYAKLTLSDKEMALYHHKDASGDSDYYDENGFSAKKPLMKTPIDGARLSSGFGMRRHPVMGYSKMHKGVDFAAPQGTPIYAAGDGVIEKIGPFSSYGKYIRIRHQAGIKTAYAHMKGFKSGLKSGSRVKQGQVIGYVGTTGRSTGAHLHYEVMINGKQTNPRTIKIAGGKELGGKTLKAFLSSVKTVNHDFRATLGQKKSLASLTTQNSGTQ